MDNYTKNFPFRVKPSGRLTIANGAYVLYVGKDCTQKRGQFIISNEDASSLLYLALHKADTTIFTPVWARSTLAFNIGEDVYVYNNSGGTVTYVVCELFYDEGVELPGGFAGSAGGLVPETAAAGTPLPTGTPLAKPTTFPNGRPIAANTRTAQTSGRFRSNSGSVKL